MHTEIQRSAQVLLNNGYKQEDIDRQVRRIIDLWYHPRDNISKREEIKLYYRAYFSTACKEEERIIKQIIRRNVKPTNPEKRLNLIIYYKSKKTSHLLLRNSPKMRTEPTQQSCVVYRFTCARGNCEALPSTYIGMTTMKLSRRLSYHLTSGAPRNHLRQEHRTELTREILVEGTDIITTCPDVRRLPILEALYIKDLEPNLNIQASDLQALPSMKRITARTTATGTTNQRRERP